MFVQDDKVEVLGEVEDVMGNIKSPYYKVDIDHYLKTFLDQAKLKKGQLMFIVDTNKRVLLMQDIH